MNNKSKEIQKKEVRVPDQIERTRASRIYNPDVDIIERNDDIVLIADMAGVDETSVEIIIEKNILSIYARAEPEIPDKMRLIYAEYGLGDYQRVFTLSGEIDREKIKATVKNGVLKLIMPKAETVKTRKVEVKAGA
jgi:HSP20 family molecular chaperone IbpA